MGNGARLNWTSVCVCVCNSKMSHTHLTKYILPSMPFTIGVNHLVKVEGAFRTSQSSSNSSHFMEYWKSPRIHQPSFPIKTWWDCQSLLCQKNPSPHRQTLELFDSFHKIAFSVRMGLVLYLWKYLYRCLVECALEHCYHVFPILLEMLELSDWEFMGESTRNTWVTTLNAGLHP